MPAPFEFFEHTADIGVHVWGASLPDLFANAARAMYEAMGELKRSEIGKEKRVEFSAESLEDFLHDWLAELLFEVEVNGVLYDQFQIDVRLPKLEATVRGGVINFGRSQTNEEIKAVTYHQLRVEQLPDNSWQATVIFDV